MAHSRHFVQTWKYSCSSSAWLHVILVAFPIMLSCLTQLTLPQGQTSLPIIDHCDLQVRQAIGRSTISNMQRNMAGYSKQILHFTLFSIYSWSVFSCHRGNSAPSHPNCADTITAQDWYHFAFGLTNQSRSGVSLPQVVPEIGTVGNMKTQLSTYFNADITKMYCNSIKILI